MVQPTNQSRQAHRRRTGGCARANTRSGSIRRASYSVQLVRKRPGPLKCAHTPTRAQPKRGNTTNITGGSFVTSSVLPTGRPGTSSPPRQPGGGAAEPLKSPALHCSSGYSPFSLSAFYLRAVSKFSQNQSHACVVRCEMMGGQDTAGAGGGGFRGGPQGGTTTCMCVQDECAIERAHPVENIEPATGKRWTRGTEKPADNAW